MEQRLGSCVANDGRRLAFAVAGDGAPLVLAPWWVSHLERNWLDHEQRAFFEGLAAHHTVVRFDRPGVGLSERDRGPCTLETEASYIGDLVDHLGFDQFDLLGISCGGPPAVAFAAGQPHRVDKVVLFGTYARGNEIGTTESQEAFVAFTRTNWGLASRTMTDLFAPGASAEQLRLDAEGSTCVRDRGNGC